MASVNIHEAKTQLSKLLARVRAGEEIIIAKNGQPIARLVRVEPPARRLFGSDRGRFEVPEDFDAPLSEDVLKDFE
jgi:prevent-host-death family protein